MFPVETLPPPYYEERSAAVEATRQQQQQKEAASQSAKTTPAPTTQQSCPPQSAMPLGASSTGGGVLGSIYQGFVKKASSVSPTATPPPGLATTGTSQATEKEKKQMEALLAEMRRDTDRYYAVPSWH